MFPPRFLVAIICSDITCYVLDYQCLVPLLLDIKAFLSSKAIINVKFGDC